LTKSLERGKLNKGKLLLKPTICRAVVVERKERNNLEDP